MKAPSVYRFMFAVLFAAICLPQIVIAEENEPFWPQWRGPNRDGISPATGLIDNWNDKKPQLLWMVEGTGSGYASVSIADGVIYTVGDDDRDQFVVALYENDGSIRWKQRISDKSNHAYPGSRCTPSIDGDALYVVGSNGDIVCLARADGAIRWSKNFEKEWQGKMMSGWGYAESPLVDGDLVLCTPGGPQALIVALDKKTGREKWRTPQPQVQGRGKDGAGYSSIVISNAGGVKQYVQLVGRGLVSVRASDGQLLWGYNNIANDVANIPTPIPAGDFIFSSTGYQTGAALVEVQRQGTRARPQLNTREVYFLEPNRVQNHHGGLILLGDYIYGGNGHNNGFPICVELKTGKIAWGGDQRGAGRGSAAVTYADGHFYFRYQSGELALIKATPKGYELKGSFTPEYVQDPSWAHPVVTAGKLYLREQDKLMCYDVSK